MIPLLLRVIGHEHARPIRLALALMTVTAVVEGLAWALVVPVVEALLSPAPDDVRPWLAALGLSILGWAALRFASDVVGFRTGVSLLDGIYRRLGDHLVRLPIGWYSAGRVGELSVLASRGVLEAMSVVAHLLAPLVGACVTPATIAVVMLVVDWRVGLAAILLAPLVVAAQAWTAGSVARSDAEREARGRVATDRVLEYLHAQSALRAGGRLQQRHAALDEALVGLAEASRRSVVGSLPGAVGGTAAAQLIFVAVLVLGTSLTLGGDLAPASLVAVLVLTSRGIDPLMQLTEIGGRLRSARSQLLRLEGVLAAPPLPESDHPSAPGGHGLQVDSLTVRRADRSVLDDVSLTVPDGSRIALVGPSGAGKSSLLHLIARFHDPDSGAVRLGGTDVRDLSTEVLRSRVSIVLQDVYLFDGTIEDNVLMGRPGARRAELLDASRAARLDEVVDRLPDGWRTPVGEGGAFLSGGERQRVAIARALLKDAPVLLLDEITSALDPDNEAAVHDGIARLTRGRTVVLVAHRLATIADADTIAFLDRGRVVEKGTHDDLLSRGGRYADFWSAQNPHHQPTTTTKEQR